MSPTGLGPENDCAGKYKPSVANNRTVLSSENMLHKDNICKCSVEKITDRGSQGIDAKTNWLAVDRQLQSNSDSDSDSDSDSGPISWEMSSAREGEKGWRYNWVDSSIVRYSPDSNEVSTEAEESPLLEAATRKRLVKTLQAGEHLACSDL
jgi:hypothetical protein